MRTIEEIHPHALRTLDTAHLIHGEVMNELIEVQGEMDNPLSKHHRPYLNGKLDVLLGVYTLLNDIMWKKEQLERTI